MAAQPNLRLVVPTEESPPRWQAALELLLQSWDYAHAAGTAVWEFADELGSLCVAGASHSDLRWLLRQGIIAHALETSPSRAARRTFKNIASLSLPERACFVLTHKGEALARSTCVARAAFQRNGNGAQHALVPQWHADRRELSLGDKLVKRFRRPAPNQETILAAFQEESWPTRIDDPLSGQPERDPIERLHHTIIRLNRSQTNRLIRFAGDGTGQGIRWELIDIASTPRRQKNGS